MNNKVIASTLVISGIISLAITFFFPFGSIENEKSQNNCLRNELIISADLNSMTLNPGKVSDAANKGLLNLIYSRLVKPEGFFNITGDLLKKWSFDRVQLQYLLELKDNVYFQNGKLLTTEDVYFSFKEWLQGGNLDTNFLSSIEGAKQFQEGLTSEISGIKIISSKILSVKLLFNDVNFITNLTTPRFVIYPSNFLSLSRENYFAKPIGSGPFSVTSINDSIILEKNNEYFKGVPLISTIKILNANDNEATSLLESQKIDLVAFNNVNTKELPAGFIKKRVRSFKKLLLILNQNQNHQLENKSIRELIVNNLLDESLLEFCFPQGKKTREIIPEGMIGHRKRVGINTNISNNIKLEEPITLYIENFQGATCFADGINKKNKAANLPIVVKAEPFNVLYQLYETKKLGGWFELLSFKNEDPYNVLQYFSPESPEFLVGKITPKIRDIYNIINQETNLSVRYSLYSELEDNLMNEKLVYPFLDVDDFIIYKEELSEPFAFGASSYIQNWHALGSHCE